MSKRNLQEVISGLVSLGMAFDSELDHGVLLTPANPAIKTDDICAILGAESQTSTYLFGNMFTSAEGDVIASAVIMGTKPTFILVKEYFQ